MIYNTKYENSWALIIGINKYMHVNPLSYACNDAIDISKMLVEKFNFTPDKITLLLDEQATKANIMSSFMKYANGNTSPDDRIIVFYAGHGHTITGNRGEVGYLIPYDAELNDLASFIRWDDLTRNSELIQAKHILYIMDACYGGLAITRSLQPGSVRFLNDMLRRSSRQVLTAGKANETVADANGPIAGHSIFTGHLIQALEGNAATFDGVITANGVMSYVYEKVSKDINSNQTPHYGFFDGDGDMILIAPILNSSEENTQQDILIEIPATLTDNRAPDIDLVDKTKEYLSEERFRIKFDDLINQELRRFIDLTSEVNFPLQGSITDITKEFSDRLIRYEQSVHNLRSVMTCICYWGNSNNTYLIKKILSRSAESNVSSNGYTLFINMQTYPTMLLLYAGGISAIAADNYNNLYTLFNTRMMGSYKRKMEDVITASSTSMIELNDAFKRLPGYERNYVPRSEYLFKLLQPDLDDLLFLGKSYENIFDRFEIFLALIYADLNTQEGGKVWGPPGRFVWKYSRGESEYSNIKIEADLHKEEWAPLKVGLFRGSYTRFCELYNAYLEVINRVGWY